MSDDGPRPGGGAPGPSALVAQDFAAKDFADGELERLLLAAQDDLTLLCAEDTTILYASPSSVGLLGYKPEEAIGRSFTEFIHPDDLAMLAAEWERYLELSDKDPVQFRARRRDGSCGWYEAHASRVDDPRLPGCSCINMREVEHLRLLHARIAEAEARAKIGSWRWIMKGGEPEWTASMYRILGYEPSDKPFDLEWALNLTHPDDRDAFRDCLLDCLENPKSFTVPTRKLASDGEYRHIIQHCYVERDLNGDVVALIGICQDVTAQAEAEAALRKSESEYRMLADEASDVILRVNASGCCTFASPACKSTLGYSPQEITGKAILRFVEPSDHAALNYVYQNALKGTEAQRVTFHGAHKYGHTVWLEAGVRAIMDEAGKLSELIIVARDITERRQYEEGLRHARERAEAANLTKSKFLANMSHELRTPLNAVIGFSDIMREEMFGPVGSDQYSEYVQLIHESGQYLLELINDILDMSKIEAGKYELFLEDIDLSGMIESCLRIVETRARTNGVTLEWSTEDGLPDVPADERALKQIFLNLLSNAIKFSEDGGKVSVTAKTLGESVFVRVNDTGCGIPAHAIPRLAKPFEQAMTNASQAQTGTGLGLALVKSFVELHGGKFAIESVEGEGTTVTFTLPLAGAFHKKSA